MNPRFPNLGKSAPIAVASFALLGTCIVNATENPQSTGQASLSAYDQAIRKLADGKQPEAERMVEEACLVDFTNPDLWFLRGVLKRSRFGKYNAGLCLTIAWSLDPSTDRAQAAEAILFMDRGKMVEEGFQTLEKLIDKNPDDLLVRWLFAIQCREHRWAQYSRAEEGARQYEAILEAWNPGPVLVHQTYANILSEQLGRHEEALIHRKIAVQQSRKAWTCQGYGNTLRKLGRFDEAIEWLEKAVELDPDASAYQRSLRRAKMEKLRMGKASTSFEQARIFGGGYTKNLPKALELYEKAAEEGDASAYMQMGIIYRNGGSGVPKNQAKAAECFEKGYEAGLWHCATLLGIMYGNGRAGPPNEELALEWFLIGAEHDQYRSIQKLIYYYAAHGDSAKCNVQKAQKYLEKLETLKPDSSDTKTLSAIVHARAGRFDQAVEIQKKIVARNKGKGFGSDPSGHINRSAKRLECYQKGEPWVEDFRWPARKEQNTEANSSP